MLRGGTAPARSTAPTPRARWEKLADRLLLAPRPYASDHRALIRLPGPESANGRWSDGLEGYARTFLLAAFRLAGANGEDPHHFAEWYAEGLTAGVDPASRERWPTFAESNQAKVEAASIAIALHETRSWIWDRLTGRTREQLLHWLGQMVGTDMPPNNWIWFQAVTEAFSRTAGGSWRADDLDRTIELTDAWYTGDGWYSDGLSGGAHRNYDHYSGWAMHFYPLWFCRILGDAAPEGPGQDLADRYRRRLRRYLQDYRRLVGANGSPLVQGRSLTYRFATLAPLWTGALFDATPLEPGETGALADRTLDHFTGHGAVNGDGLLPLGWHHAFPRIRQAYSGPASPYWASKGFAGLLLPAGHPVWTEPRTALPVERADHALTLAAPGWLVSTTAADGIVRVVNHGSDHADPARPVSDDPNYARLAYSTHTAPGMPRDPAGGPVDSTVTLVDEAGHAAHRRPLHRIAVQGATGVSRSRAHWPHDEEWDPFGGPDTAHRLGPWITVGSVLRGAVEIRAVRVDPAAEDNEPQGSPHTVHPGPWRLRLGGWPLADADADADIDAYRNATDGASPRVTVGGPDGTFSTVVGLAGFDHAGLYESRGSTPLGAVCTVPLLLTDGPPRSGRVHAAAVHLGGTRLDDAQLPHVAWHFTEPGGDATVTVSWPDGRTDALRLPKP
ncbi:DUF2264 domain-containing protein [Streptomyces sp. PSRA5]|uniref:DUF2264 domain-containing protein n=1 Tax=Streptomyces panacea TaxID=3035064 RepID=UPI00339C8274